MPFAAKTSRRDILFFVESDGDHLTGISLAPDGYSLVSLENHARLKQLWEADLGNRLKAQESETQ